MTSLCEILNYWFPRDLSPIICFYAEPQIDFWKFVNELNLVAIVERIRPGDTYTSYLLRTGISDAHLWIGHDDSYEPTLERETDKWLWDGRHNNVVHVVLYNTFLWRCTDTGEYQDFYMYGNPIARLIYGYLGWFYGFVRYRYGNLRS